MRSALLLGTGLLAALVAAPAGAVNISLYNPANQGISTLRYTVQGSRIDLYEDWGKTANGDLLFSGLTANVDYVVFKHITNHSDKTWTSLACELLDPLGQLSDESDPLPYPDWVPAGFSTSDDMDGLSFAQGSNLARTSQRFHQLAADEYTYRRDYLDFYDGQVASAGGTDLISFGLRDRNPASNEAFILSQRPNGFTIPQGNPPPVPSIPEPRSVELGVMGLGFGALALRRKG
jgi:hypothetical protein